MMTQGDYRKKDPMNTRTGHPGIAELHSASTASAALAPSATRRSKGYEVFPKSPKVLLKEPDSLEH
jgi:hypothetical protein